jgi:hypothetical protein
MVIVTLADAKTELRIPSGDTSNDVSLQLFVDAVCQVVQGIVGPVDPTSYTEWYDGGRDTIVLEHRPVISITSVTEWQGSVSYPLNDATPPGDVNDVFGYMPFKDRGTIQRTSYGVPSWFAALPWWATRTPAWFTGQANRAAIGLGRVQVVYTAGWATAPPNVRLGTLELIRENWSDTQRGQSTGRPIPGPDGVPEQTYAGYFVTARVRELLLVHQQSRQIA